MLKSTSSGLTELDIMLINYSKNTPNDVIEAAEVTKRRNHDPIYNLESRRGSSQEKCLLSCAVRSGRVGGLFPRAHLKWILCTLRPLHLFRVRFQTVQTCQDRRGQRLFTIALHHRTSNLIPIRRRQTLLWNHFGKLKTACPSSSNISWPTFCCWAISNILHFIDLAWVSFACLHVSLSRLIRAPLILWLMIVHPYDPSNVTQVFK